MRQRWWSIDVLKLDFSRTVSDRALMRRAPITGPLDHDGISPQIAWSNYQPAVLSATTIVTGWEGAILKRATSRATCAAGILNSRKRTSDGLVKENPAAHQKVIPYRDIRYSGRFSTTIVMNIPKWRFNGASSCSNRLVGP